jgi:hypothetical protein
VDVKGLAIKFGAILLVGGAVVSYILNRAKSYAKNHGLPIDAQQKADALATPKARSQKRRQSSDEEVDFHPIGL